MTTVWTVTTWQKYNAPITGAFLTEKAARGFAREIRESSNSSIEDVTIYLQQHVDIELSDEEYGK